MASYRWVDDLTVTCRLTACTPGSAPGPTLGVEYGKPLLLLLFLFYHAFGSYQWFDAVGWMTSPPTCRKAAPIIPQSFFAWKLRPTGLLTTKHAPTVCTNTVLTLTSMNSLNTQLAKNIIQSTS